MQPRTHFSLLFLLIIGALSFSCYPEASSQTTEPVAQASPSQTPRSLEPEHLFDIFDEYSEGLIHHGYEVRTLKEKMNYQYERENGEQISIPSKVSYVVVKRNGRVVAKFDGPVHPVGNTAELGLFDLLGDKSEQLIIAMTVPRGGRHVVVSLQPEFRVLFDTDEYGVGREEFYVIDIDKDGIHEISLPVTAFYTMQDKMYIGEIPLPEIVFKYSSEKKKYFPANSYYADYALRGIDDEKRPLNDKDNYLSRRLRILLSYIYAGKETEGWMFFDNAYQRPDKQEMRLRIQSILNDQPVYKYLYQ
jgi:hypothetical protein